MKSVGYWNSFEVALFLLLGAFTALLLQAAIMGWL